MGAKRDVNMSLLMSKLRHGYWLLSRMNWNSFSGVQISVAGVLGVAGFILAISKDSSISNYSSLPWLSDRHSTSNRLGLVPGLKNLGNNCFLNVILQALASCLCFRSYLQSIMEKCESLTFDEHLEKVPLIESLAALLEELCMVYDGRRVLSPRKVMLAMHSYIPNFNLTGEQDAAEAFLHLLSSLREEFSESYVPTHLSLADISVFPDRRILTPRKEDYSEQERWQQHYLGPFDGILGSALSCQSCSFEIMMDFEFFHSLPLSPVLGRGGTIMAGCTVEDCLKQFIAAEILDNYKCNNCWHIAAVKYLLSVGGSEEDIRNLQSCGKLDSCGCRDLFQLKGLPWSNSLSRTFKQLNIARCPKILCIHLQRVSMNQFGELFKLQGHICFPMVLNLLPFIKSRKSWTGIKIWDDHVQKGQQDTRLYHVPCVGIYNRKLNRKMLNGVSSENEKLEQLGTQESRATKFNPLDPEGGMQAIQGESSLHHTGLGTRLEQTQPKNEVGPSSLETHMYQLVSVVEHFGRVGSGHYTAYRRFRAFSENDYSVKGTNNDSWFSISDSEVCNVSEQDVLSAEASLLFYERI